MMEFIGGVHNTTVCDLKTGLSLQRLIPLESRLKPFLRILTPLGFWKDGGTRFEKRRANQCTV